MKQLSSTQLAQLLLSHFPKLTVDAAFMIAAAVTQKYSDRAEAATTAAQIACNVVKIPANKCERFEKAFAVTVMTQSV